MKYTIEQKRILSLCRKYKGVRVHFKDLFCTINIADESTTFLTEKFYKEESDIEMWMKTWTIPKQVGRPKGSTKPNRKVKKTITFTTDQWSAVERIQMEQGLKYASHAIGLAVEAFSKNKTAYEIQSQLGNDCCICKHVEYCPNAKWDNDKLNTCPKWQLIETEKEVSNE